MALKPCRECKKKVSTEAVTCPSCGVPNPTQEKPKVKPWNFGNLLLKHFVMVLLDVKGNSDLRVEEYLHTEGVEHAATCIVLINVFQWDLQTFLSFCEDDPMSCQDDCPVLNFPFIVFLSTECEPISFVVNLFVWK